MKKSKCCFSLLEMVIGFSLLSLLLSSLFLCFKNQLLFFRKNDVMESTVFKEIFLHDHLASRFLNLKVDTKTSLYTTHTDEEGCQLHFQFNNGVQQDLAFAGDVKGLVYINRQTKELISEVISLDTQESKKSVLAEDVKALTFSFIHPDNFEEQAVWEESEKSPPLGICMKLHQNDGQNKNFYFILVQTPPYYHYKESTP